MKLTRSKLKEMIKDELHNPQSDDATFKTGIIVKDINPNCPHHKSMGEVTKVSGNDVTYEVTNVGKLFKPGDELTKSKDQLIPLNSENIKSLSESKLRKMIKQELNESTREGLVDAIFDLQRITKRIDFKKVREWADKNGRASAGLLGALHKVLTILRKIK